MGIRKVVGLGRFSRVRMIALSFILAAVVLAVVITPGLAQAQTTGTTFTVNSTGDASDYDAKDNRCDTDASTAGRQCTLRAAIEQANRNTSWKTGPTHDTIEFDIPGTGVQTIRPNSGLPTVEDPVTIDGYSQPGASANTLAVGNDAVLKIELDGINTLRSNGQGAIMLDIAASGSTVKGLVINRIQTQFEEGHYSAAIFVSSRGRETVIEGNFIGTDVAGTADRSEGSGVRIEHATNVTVGGKTPAARNLISGNQGAIGFTGPDGVTLGNLGHKVQGNYIGTDRHGTAPLGDDCSGCVSISNCSGILIGGSTSGAGNVIAGEVTIYSPGYDSGANETPHATRNRILSNSILFSDSTSSDAWMGIDLTGDGRTPNDPGDRDEGANMLQNFPELTSATEATIKGKLNSLPDKTYTIQFFSSPSGTDKGNIFIGERTVKTNRKGNAFFSFAPTTSLGVGKEITATATNAVGNTSEFSDPLTVSSG